MTKKAKQTPNREIANKADCNLSKRRRWLFRSLAMLLGLLPFLIVEFVLALANLPSTPASDDPLVDLHQLKPLFVRSADGEAWEIPASRFNFFRPEAFPVEKAQNDIRIFVLGGSTVQGRPYSTETAFSTWLELALNAVDDSKRWQVINCGGISYASYRLAPMLDEVLQLQPDLIILYTGHNEFLEERTYKSIKQLPPFAARSAHVLGELRTVQLLRNVLFKQSGMEASRWVAKSEVETRLDIAGGLADFTRNEQWRSDVIQHFEMTLNRMLHRCGQAGIPTIVCDPAADIKDTPPFKIENSPKLSSREIDRIEQWWSVASRAESNVDDRLTNCMRILQIDPHHAGAAFVQGRLLFEQGRFNEAEKWLREAKDWDVCPLRAPTEIQLTAKSLAAEHEVPWLATSDLLDALVKSGIAGNTIFVDHVHPTIATHQKIALWLLELIVTVGIASPVDNADQRVKVVFDQHLRGLGEAYFLRGKQRLEGLRQWAAGRAGELSLDSAANGN